MIQYSQNSIYKIKTPLGYQSFKGVKTLYKDEYYRLTLSNGRTTNCSTTHIFIVDGMEKKADRIEVGTFIDSIDGKVQVLDKLYIKKPIKLYDIVEVDNGNIFNVNGIISHNCDFSTSGDTVLEPNTLNYYQETTIREPVERRDQGGNYWLWEYPDSMKTYMVVADVARGDGKDFSTFHVFDVDELKQVAEFKDQLPTKDFARKLVSVATDWNNALLVIENASIGWDVVTTVQEAGYANLYYSPKSELVGTQIDLYVAKFDRGDGMVPGFGTNQRTRPLVIEKARSFLEEKVVIIRSQRLLDELRVFIWKNGKAQAMQGYNDDLVMPACIGLFLRDTALRFRQTAMNLTYASLNSFTRTSDGFQVYTGGANNEGNPWTMQAGNEQTDLTWLL